MKGRFVFLHSEPHNCPKCSLQERFFVYCPICEGNCFHDLESFKIHFQDSKDENHALYNPFKAYTLEQLCSTLEVTIKKDQTTKAITFLNMILAQTAEDPFNCMFRARSASGKSYIPLELCQYFPESEVIIYSGASPTSFFHEKGALVIETEKEKFEPLGIFASPIEKQIEELKAKEDPSEEDKQKIKELQKKLSQLYGESKIYVDLEKRILIFTDQPNTKLLEKMRSFLSHDKKYIEFPITDKMGHGGLRTKHVILAGFAAVIFCTVSQDFDEQEANRNFILSPESEQNKILESLKLLDNKLSDRDLFRDMLERDPRRSALMLRVEIIRASGISRITIDPGIVLERFLELHKEGVQNRATRDFTRLYSLIYGHALLNAFQRERLGDSIKATIEDVEAGFSLYKPIMDSNELGLSPETYMIFTNIVKPAYIDKNKGAEIYRGLSYVEICQAYQKIENRILGYEECKAHMRAIQYAGLAVEEQDEKDKRRTLFVPMLTTEEIAKASEKAAVAHNGIPYSLDSVCAKCGIKIETLPIFEDGRKYHQGCLIGSDNSDYG